MIRFCNFESWRGRRRAARGPVSARRVVRYHLAVYLVVCAVEIFCGPVFFCDQCLYTSVRVAHEECNACHLQEPFDVALLISGCFPVCPHIPRRSLRRAFSDFHLDPAAVSPDSTYHC